MLFCIADINGSHNVADNQRPEAIQAITGIYDKPACHSRLVHLPGYIVMIILYFSFLKFLFEG